MNGRNRPPEWPIRRDQETTEEPRTERETEILSEMAQGKNNAAIAASLVLSDRAVEKHINSLFSKLGLSEAPVHRRVAAVLAFLEAEQGPISAS